MGGPEIKKDLAFKFFEEMLDISEMLVLDLRLHSFERQCFEVNELLLLLRKKIYCNCLSKNVVKKCY